MVKEGLVEVQRLGDADQKSRHYLDLCMLEDEAKAESKGKR